MNIRFCEFEDLKYIAKLFDDYRVFYGQASDYKSGYKFLKERFDKDESIIIVAEKDKKLLGFIQIFPIFTSVRLKRGYLLNDLFVDPLYRRMRIAEKLIKFSFENAKKEDVDFVLLETATDNIIAQKLYKKVGMHLENDVYYFSKNIKI